MDLRKLFEAFTPEELGEAKSILLGEGTPVLRAKEGGDEEEK